ncbi:ATP synthase gamma chain [Trichosporon asahii var. asahii CBS 8904]|uniref:ATP synthase subunit gamma n=2 Tax=Trichosporon asahii var. asahii TaxID=189963 RepID=K1VZ95_TRIAC|nr:ATP synthase gamma chain, precursor [Trichosporon asahii var. asahii CBS 2479]EJT53254.1 ATP synthase gamma chain, precursor [Trichosporon asahii var. asahii CBS 2479]EKD02088.1 ATP synthase gamma chain [Trichosporon asahii var. asahii CBS 8904]
MFARSVRPALTAARTANQQQKAGMATLKEIDQRLKSVRNIEKITKSMKVVASTKLTRAEKAMREAKKYGGASNEVYEQTKEGDDAAAAAPAGEAVEKKPIYLVMSSDGGLCGGIHSSLSRYVRKIAAQDPSIQVAIVGDKPKAQLTRMINNDNIRISFSGVGKDVPTFGEAVAIADELMKHGGDFNEVRIVSNHYISALSYEAQTVTVKSAEELRQAAGFQRYEMEEDVSKDLAEFSLANAIYALLVEGHAAEISARRTAMENASNNANDMMGSLQLQFNRGRQAVITTELIDIITGASAL